MMLLYYDIMALEYYNRVISRETLLALHVWLSFEGVFRGFRVLPYLTYLASLGVQV